MHKLPQTCEREREWKGGGGRGISSASLRGCYPHTGKSDSIVIVLDNRALKATSRFWLESDLAGTLLPVVVGISPVWDGGEKFISRGDSPLWIFV